MARLVRRSYSEIVPALLVILRFTSVGRLRLAAFVSSLLPLTSFLSLRPSLRAFIPRGCGAQERLLWLLSGSPVELCLSFFFSMQHSESFPSSALGLDPRDCPSLFVTFRVGLHFVSAFLVSAVGHRFPLLCDPPRIPCDFLSGSSLTPPRTASGQNETFQV